MQDYSDITFEELIKLIELSAEKIENSRVDESKSREEIAASIANKYRLIVELIKTAYMNKMREIQGARDGVDTILCSLMSKNGLDSLKPLTPKAKNTRKGGS